MPYVFISYSTKDAASAEYLLNSLESMYIKCWMASRDIPKGDNFAEKIPAAMREAKLVLVLVSRNSLESPQVLNEMTFASSIGITRIAVLLDDAPLSNSFVYHIPEKNRYQGNGRLVAVADELGNRIHEELSRWYKDPTVSEQEAHTRKVAPMIWLMLLVGVAVILIGSGIIMLDLGFISTTAFRRYSIGVVLILLALSAVPKTPLFRENASFYRKFLKLLELIERLP